MKRSARVRSLRGSATLAVTARALAEVDVLAGLAQTAATRRSAIPRPLVLALVPARVL